MPEQPSVAAAHNLVEPEEGAALTVQPGVPGRIRCLDEDKTGHELKRAAGAFLFARIPQRPHREGARLDKEATAAFTQGTDDREIADSYVRNSLLLAMVLVLARYGSAVQDAQSANRRPSCGGRSGNRLTQAEQYWDSSCFRFPHRALPGSPR